MVHLSKHADYAVMIMAHLGTFHSPTRISARELAKELFLPQPTVSKLLKLLAKGGLLDATLGMHGGYALSKPVQDIAVCDVIEAIDGMLSLTECALAEPGQCKTEKHCGVKRHWVLINQAIRNTLKHIPLSLMIEDPKLARTPLPQHNPTYLQSRKVRHVQG